MFVSNFDCVGLLYLRWDPDINIFPSQNLLARVLHEAILEHEVEVQVLDPLAGLVGGGLGRRILRPNLILLYL